jgi:hypothetical protein
MEDIWELERPPVTTAINDQRQLPRSDTKSSIVQDYTLKLNAVNLLFRGRERRCWLR